MFKKPYFEMNRDYNIKVGNPHDWRDSDYCGRVGVARFLGFGRGTSYGFIEAAFDVSFPDGDCKTMGQTELMFLDELKYIED